MPDVDVLLRKALRDGDRRAFDALHADTYPMVLRMANSFIHNQEEAEDIVQAAFLVLHKRGRNIREEKAFSAWMWKTVRFMALRLQRDKARRSRAEMNAPEQVSPSESAALGQLLNKLGASDRQVLVLRFYRGLSVEEVGQALNISTAAAQMRIGRALDRAKRKGGPGLFAVLLGLASASNSNAVVPPSPLSGNVSLMSHQLAASHSPLAVAASGFGGATIPVLAGSGVLVGAVAVGIWLSHQPPTPDTARLDLLETQLTGRYRGTVQAEVTRLDDFKADALIVVRRMKNPDRIEIRKQEGDRPVDTLAFYPVLGRNEVSLDGQTFPATFESNRIRITVPAHMEDVFFPNQKFRDEISGFTEFSWGDEKFRFLGVRTGKRFSSTTKIEVTRVKD